MKKNFATAGLLTAQLIAQIAYPTHAGTIQRTADQTTASNNSGKVAESASPSPVAAVTASASATVTALKNWFNQYDEIRKQAQMSDAERTLADDLLKRPLQVLLWSKDRQDAHSLLERLVSRYRVAAQQMGELPRLAETQQLQAGYARYFKEGRSLFYDALQAQENPLAKDPSNGPSFLGQLRERKDSLEALKLTLKAIDRKVREEFGIPAYPY